MLIDERDFQIDIEHEAAAPMTQVESDSKRKSQQSLNEANVKRKKKKSGSAGKRRETKKQEEAPVIEKLSPSPWVTLDPSITDDISLEHRELIEFYVNPLDCIPETLDVGWVEFLIC